MRRQLWGALAGLFLPLVLSAQEGGAGGACARPEVPEGSRQFCYTVAQAAESAQPQIGILVAGGNVTPGSASTGGLRLGILPGVSATGKVNLVLARTPDILAEGAESSQGVQQRKLLVPALSGTASVAVFPGISLAPTMGGIGAVDLLGSATWLPLKEAGGGFRAGTASTSFGVGGRIGILKESFTLPGASVSLMYHRLGKVEYGAVCESPLLVIASEQPDYRLESGSCMEEGDPGEFSFDLTGWSTRAQVSKRLLILGLAAGVGYDRLSSDVGFGFRSRCPVSALQGCFVRVTDARLENDRWSTFVNASLGGLLGSLVVEAGWLQGSEPITGYDASRGFDPAAGTLFGSVGVRLTL